MPTRGVQQYCVMTFQLTRDAEKRTTSGIIFPAAQSTAPLVCAGARNAFCDKSVLVCARMLHMRQCIWIGITIRAIYQPTSSTTWITCHPKSTIGSCLGFFLLLVHASVRNRNMRKQPTSGMTLRVYRSATPITAHPVCLKRYGLVHPLIDHGSIFCQRFSS